MAEMECQGAGAMGSEHELTAPVTASTKRVRKGPGMWVFSDEIIKGPSGLGDGEQVEVRESPIFWFADSSGWERKSHFRLNEVLRFS